jgi:Tol biopolymer transport system component
MNVMKKFGLILKNIFGFLGIVFISSCATTNQTVTQVDLSNWRAESENIANLSLLLEDDGTEGSPALLNENTLIFESKKNDNYDLWSIDIKKKGGIVQLTTYDGADRLPCPHPDGKRYCFLSDRSGTGFYLGEIGKPTVISLVEIQQPFFGGWVSGDISPDGNTFIYVSGKFIWTYDFKTKTKTQFVQGTHPKWSPDGTKIIYRKIAKEIGANVSTSVWLMNPDGTEQTELISGTNDYSFGGARISPDGKKILYLRQKITIRGENVIYGNNDIWICNIDGTEHTQVTTHPLSDQEAIWIDNKTIVFCSDRPQSGLLKNKKWDLWQLKLNL